MKNRYLIILLAMIVSSCTGSKKIKTLTEFTTKLVPISKEKVIEGSRSEIEDFGNRLSYLQNGGIVAEIERPDSYKLTKLNLSSGKLSSVPTLVNRHIYTLDKQGKVVSYNLREGKKAWQISLEAYKGKIIKGTLLYNRGKLYITADLQIYVVDSESGKILQKSVLEDSVKNYPSMVANAMFFQTSGNKLLAYNVDNWAVAWAYETWPEYISSSTLTAPLIFGNQIITGYSTGQLVSVGPDGNELWQMSLSKDSSEQLGYSTQDLACQPVIQDKYLYVASNNGNLLKIDLTNSSIVWRKDVEDAMSMSISGNTIFLTNNARQVAALSTNDGSVKWATILAYKKNIEKDRLKPTNFTPPLVTNLGVFVFAKDGAGYLLDIETGSILKAFDIPKNVTSFGIDDKKIILFNETNGFKLN